MALVIQQEQFVQSYIPYERPPDNIALWSAIPRGMVQFTISAALDAKPVNDDALLSMLATLPPNFGYVLADIHLSLIQNRAQDWNDTVTLNLQNFFRKGVAGLTGNYMFAFDVSAQDNNTIVMHQGSSRAGQGASKLPHFPLVAFEGTSGVLINFQAWNNLDTVSTIGLIESYITFWQFDLEQIRKYPINSPLPVQLR